FCRWVARSCPNPRWLAFGIMAVSWLPPQRLEAKGADFGERADGLLDQRMVNTALAQMHGDGMELIAELRQADQNLRHGFMLNGRAAGPARRIAAEHGLRDEG